MKIKSMFITIVINIFVMLFASILLEYNDLSERFQKLEMTVETSLDSALMTATASEEMFTDKFQASLGSYASDDANASVYAMTLLWRSNSWHQVNSYLLAYYYKDNGCLPEYAHEVTDIANYGGSNKLGFVYNWLYGGTGSDYNKTSLNWANRNKTKKQAYMSTGSNRIATSTFKQFYNAIGYRQQTVGYLKSRIPGTNYFTMSLKTYPVLVNMGLKLHPYNEVSSSLTHDNFTSSMHYGKAKDSITDTTYYLTPASLGVTYVPVEVVKPLFIANLDTLARLNKLSGANSEKMSTTEIADTLNSADGCIPTSVYDGFSSTPYSHTASSWGEKIVNDGMVEYDLSSVQVKVDYFVIDFGDMTRRSQNALIVSKIEGCVSGVANNGTGQDSLRDLTLSRFLSDSYDSGIQVNDSTFVSDYRAIKDTRIVARVSVRLKVHVCYESSLIQRLCHIDGTHHYDVKLWDTANGVADMSSDGIWYQYTTYFCQGR